MLEPFKKTISVIPFEKAHNATGYRRAIALPQEGISQNLDGITKGYLPVGHSFDWHNHIGYDEFFWVLQGSGKVEFEGKTTINYSAGDFVYMPTPIKHKITNTGNQTNIFYFVRVRE